MGDLAKDISYIVVMLIALLAFSGEDYRKEKLNRDVYCRMVHENAIPDYLGIAKEECK